MAAYVWQHDLKGEPERLKMMSDLLDPSSEFHLQRIGVGEGWRCFEIGAGNGSVSKWLSTRVGPTGKVIVTDLHTDLIAKLTGGNLEAREFNVVTDEPTDGPFDLIVIRALLHHLPQRREVVSKVTKWVKPGGWVFIQEPDFYPTWGVTPGSQRDFWEEFLKWAASHQIDYFVGHKVAPWMQEDGMTEISSEGHVTQYNGGSEFAEWWLYGIDEVADVLKQEGGIPNATLTEFMTLNQDPKYWTQTIAFTAVTGRRAA